MTLPKTLIWREADIHIMPAKPLSVKLCPLCTFLYTPKSTPKAHFTRTVCKSVRCVTDCTYESIVLTADY